MWLGFCSLLRLSSPKSHCQLEIEAAFVSVEFEKSTADPFVVEVKSAMDICAVEDDMANLGRKADMISSLVRIVISLLFCSGII